MRENDAPFPAVVAHTLPDDAPMFRWPGQLTIAVERLPLAAYTWDDGNAAVKWDAAGSPAPYVWDVPIITDYIDLLCDFTGLTIDHNEPDSNFLFPASRAVVSLLDADGRYSTVDADGRLVYLAAGRRLAIWWTDPDGEKWWLFHGAVSTWRAPTAGTVEIEAFCALSELAQRQGFDWYKAMPWPAYGGPIVRTSPAGATELFKAILAAVHFRGDPGNGSTIGVNDFRVLGAGTLYDWWMLNDVIAEAADIKADLDTTPLEEMQLIAMTDGGIIFTDVDDTVLYATMRWRAGRDDQRTDLVNPPWFTDNRCPDPGSGVFVVWDVELTDGDEWVATRVVFTNQNGLTISRESPNVGGWYQGLRYTYAPPAALLFTDIQITDAYGSGVDGRMYYILATRSNPKVAVSQMTVHVNDPRQDLWAFAIDRRRGDHLRFVHDYLAVDGSVVTLNADVVLVAMHHTITPDDWSVDFATTPGVPWSA